MKECMGEWSPKKFSMNVRLRHALKSRPNSVRHKRPSDPRTFTYKSLSCDEGAIRVIKVLPDGAEGPIRCLIKHISLSENHVCLSYRCGTDVPKNTISLSYCPESGPPDNMAVLEWRSFFVRDNLHAFLFRARQLDIDDWLWIDAISIDQDFVKEKNHQVWNFAQIYKKAKHVFMWLDSEGTVIDQEAMSTQKTFLSELSRVAQSASTGFSDESWANLYQLCEAEYFERMWVVPEVLLAKKVLVFWHDLCIPWGDLIIVVKGILDQSRSSFDTLSRSGMDDPDSRESTAHMCASWPTMSLLVQMQQAIWCERGKAGRGNDAEPVTEEKCRTLLRRVNIFEEAKIYIGSDLHSLVRGFGPLKCKYARDRVYSVRGLIASGHLLPIDYAEDLASLYWRVLDYQLAHNSSCHEQLRANHASDLARYLELASPQLEESLRKRAKHTSNYSDAGFLVKRRVPHKKIFPHRSQKEIAQLDVEQFDIWSVGWQGSRARSHSKYVVPVPADINDHFLTAACDMCCAALDSSGWRSLGRLQKPSTLSAEASLFLQGLPQKPRDDIDALRALKFGRESTAWLLRANFESRPSRRAGWLLGSLLDNTESNTAMAFLPMCNSKSCFQSDLMSHINSSPRLSVDKPLWIDGHEYPWAPGVARIVHNSREVTKKIRSALSSRSGRRL